MSLFWDTDVRKIDWEQQYKAILRGVFERGNEEEQNEIARFYGKARLHAAFNMAAGKNLTLHRLLSSVMLYYNRQVH